MRVDLEGNPIATEVDEIFVDSNISLLRTGVHCVEIDLRDTVLEDIHEVNRLIKGLELAKELFLEVEKEKE